MHQSVRHPCALGRARLERARVGDHMQLFNQILSAHVTTCDDPGALGQPGRYGAQGNGSGFMVNKPAAPRL